MKEKLLIYNLFPRIAGTVEDWISHIERIKYMGFNWIYINPLHYTGFSGSLYAIKDYYKLNPLFFPYNDEKYALTKLKNFIEICHNQNIKVMFDLVINHTAIDSELTKSHPEWYEKDKKGKILNPFAKGANGKKVVWGDLAKLDTTKNENGLYEYLAEMVFYYSKLGIDGFRCDAAYQVDNKLWEFIIGNIKKVFPKIKFFAETLGCTPKATMKIVDCGFDYIFNSSKYWDFKQKWLLDQYNQTKDKVDSISFPESHDTLRLYKEAKTNINYVKKIMQFTAFFSAGWMVPIGLEYCFKKKLNVVTTTKEDWEVTNFNLINFIKKINYLKNRFYVFSEDSENVIIKNKNSKIFIMQKTSKNGEQKVLYIQNIDDSEYQLCYIDDLYALFNGLKYMDYSPEYPFEISGNILDYNLRPGQCILLVVE